MLLDILFTLFLFGAVTLGFFGGTIRVTVVIIMFYLSALLASLYFTSLGFVFETRYMLDSEIARFLSFGLVLLISFVFLAGAGLYTFRHTHLPKKIQNVDRMLGVLLGFILAILVISMFSILLWNLMFEKGGKTLEHGFMQWLAGSVERSFLVQYIALNTLPDVYYLVDPLLPDSIELIFITT